MPLDRPTLVERFRYGATSDFATSPLYRYLCAHIAEDEDLLNLASFGREGQQPTNLLFAAVHYLLLDGARDELRKWYPSIVGREARSPNGAEVAFRAFCAAHRPELISLLSTRLVQTNVVKRAVALQLGLSVIGRVVSEPVVLVDVGASAGAQLVFDRFGYEVGQLSFGDPDAAVVIDTDWRSETDPPNLNRIPEIRDRFGIDLHPHDPHDLMEARWLRALVWPENAADATLLEAALRLVDEERPRIVEGDVIDLVETDLLDTLPHGLPVVVFHAGTRAHVAEERQAEFDRAIRKFGDGRPLYWLALEAPIMEDPRWNGSAQILSLRSFDASGQSATHLAMLDSHADWIEPLDM